MGNYYRGDYHRNRADWRLDNYRPAGEMVGIELEISHRDGYERVLDALPDPDRPEDRPDVEEDGSISDDTAVEIIFPPFTVDQINDPSSFFQRSIDALNRAGCTRGHNCGMHININTTGWSTELIWKVVIVTHNLHANILEAVGGRGLNDFCRQYRNSRLALLAENVVDDHHSAVGVRANRLEFRFPAATTDINQITRIVTFLRVVRDFAESLPQGSRLPPDWGDEVWGYVNTDEILGRSASSVSLSNSFYSFLETYPHPERVAQLREVLPRASTGISQAA